MPPIHRTMLFQPLRFGKLSPYQQKLQEGLKIVQSYDGRLELVAALNKAHQAFHTQYDNQPELEGKSQAQTELDTLTRGYERALLIDLARSPKLSSELWEAVLGASHYQPSDELFETLAVMANRSYNQWETT